MKNVKCVVFTPIVGNKFLAEKRPHNDTDPNKIMLPAGHVEESETLEVALMRECEEELNIVPTEYSLVHQGSCHTEFEHQDCYYYAITKWEGELMQKEVGEISWLSFDEKHKLHINDAQIMISLLNEKLQPA